MTPAIEFRNVEFRIPSGRLLLDRVSLALDEGTVTAILGRSGSGKTTLLRTVNRMIEPTAGAVLVNGRDVRDADLDHPSPRHGLRHPGNRPLPALHRGTQRRPGA